MTNISFTWKHFVFRVNKKKAERADKKEGLPHFWLSLEIPDGCDTKDAA